MTHAEALDFLRPAVIATSPEVWADLGCGGGTFTRALTGLLPIGSQVIGVDQQKQKFAHFMQADFVKDELDLQVNGLLLANSLHYVEDKVTLLRKLGDLFIGHPKFILIEYDTDRSNRWVPYPIPFQELASIFKSYQIEKVAGRLSAYGGMMYCATLCKTGDRIVF